MSEPSSERPGAARLDRWLFAVRLMGSRPLATEAVAGGRVHLNGERVKAAHALRAGDRVSFKRAGADFECTVLSIPERRGPARLATLCYEETPVSAAARVEFALRMKVATALAPRSQGRPDKHERARLRRLRGRI
jgi:ribosome-associated heat shock protein Hsp15